MPDTFGNYNNQNWERKLENQKRGLTTENYYLGVGQFWTPIDNCQYGREF